MSDIKSFAEKLVNLSIKEVTELSKILKEEYDIEPAAAAVAMPSSGTGSAENAEGAQEKTEMDVVLKSAGSAKLAVVKLVKEVTGLGLKEAKEMVDQAPKTIKEKLPKAEAESMKAKLEEAGAEVELK